MKFIIIATLAIAAFATPQFGYAPPSPSPSYFIPAASNRLSSIQLKEPVAILRDYRLQDEEGRFNVEFEAENGIRVSQAGSPDGDNGAVVKSGQYSYTAPDGTFVEVKYVANENGFQPQSNLLPVAPEFPHPIPQFVLDQIAKAAEEDDARARAQAAEFRASASVPVLSRTYRRPL